MSLQKTKFMMPADFSLFYLPPLIVFPIVCVLNSPGVPRCPVSMSRRLFSSPLSCLS